jgi:hypothetical protein
MPPTNSLRPQSDTRLAQKQNYMIALMNQVEAVANELKDVEDQLAIQVSPETSEDRWARVAAELGYTGINASANAEAAYNLLGSMIAVNLAGFYAQMQGRMG